MRRKTLSRLSQEEELVSLNCQVCELRGIAPFSGKPIRIPFAILMCFIASLQTQARTDPGTSCFPPPRQSVCDQPPPETYAEITSRLRKNLAILISRGIYTQNETGPVLFSLPLRHAPGFSGPSCYGISAFVDHDPLTPNHLLDYMGGSRTYDTQSGYNHKGTDFFLWPFMWHMMDAGEVDIISVAPGTILGKDDGHDDRNCEGWNQPNMPWNAVYILHDNGVQTWYGHMKKNSLTPKSVGERVERGEYLGKVGSSGISAGPHLHFEVYDAEHHLVDPFLGPSNSMNTNRYWLNQPPYTQSGINAVLTHDMPPRPDGCHDEERLNEQTLFSPGDLIYFGVYFRDQCRGQTTYFQIENPSGIPVDSWSFNFQNSDYWSASYWYWSRYLSPSAEPGIWGLTVEHLGTIHTRCFKVGSVEDDFGDHSSSSSPMIPDQTISGELSSPADEDHFNLDVQQSCTLLLTGESNPAHRIEIATNKDSSLMASGSLPVQVNLLPGNYKIRFYSPQGDSGAYSITAHCDSTFHYAVPHLPDAARGWITQTSITNTSSFNAVLTEDLIQVEEVLHDVPDGEFVLDSGRGMDLTPLTGTLPGDRWMLLDSSETLSGFSRFSLNRGKGEEQTAIPILQWTENHRALIFPHIPADRQQFWSGFCLNNPHRTTTLARFRLWGEYGSDLHTLLLPEFRDSFTLPAHGKLVRLFEGTVFDDALSPEKVSWIQIDADQPVIGFELFGRNEAYSNGELAGIEAQPLTPGSLTMRMGLFLHEYIAYHGFSILNPTAETVNAEILIYNQNGGILAQSPLIIPGREKKLGLLGPDGLQFPLGDSPLLHLTHPEKIASMEVKADHQLLLFSLAGKSGSLFDGCIPVSFDHRIGLPYPDQFNHYLLQVIASPESTASTHTQSNISIELREQSQGSLLWSHQITLNSNGSTLIEVPRFTDVSGTLLLNDTNKETLIGAFLWMVQGNPAETLTVHPSSVCPKLPD
jgi:hypothetical protein